jgi:hypothetical protein
MVPTAKSRAMFENTQHKTLAKLFSIFGNGKIPMLNKTNRLHGTSFDVP